MRLCSLNKVILDIIKKFREEFEIYSPDIPFSRSTAFDELGDEYYIRTHVKDYILYIYVINV